MPAEVQRSTTRPAIGKPSFDGRKNNKRPIGSPPIYQIVTEDGTVLLSAYLQPEESLPSPP